MNISLNSIGLEDKCLYEVIATTFSIQDNLIIPNAACMGIIINNDEIKVIPYPNTKTFSNLKKNRKISFNFLDNVYLYSLAGLKLPNLSNDLIKSPDRYYKYLNFGKFSFPLMKDAWAIIIGNIIFEKIINKKDQFGKAEVIEFFIKPSKLIKNRESYKLYNRAENLTIETIILATRLRLAIQKDNEIIKSKVLNQIQGNLELVDRLGKNIHVLKAIEYIRKYLNALEINLSI